MEMKFLNRPPDWLRKVYGKSIWQIAPTDSVSLTFDDGPGLITEELLRWADRRQVKLVFFIQGDLISEKSSLIKEMAGSGHQIGSHFLTHRSYWLAAKDTFQDELKRSVAALEDIVEYGIQYCRAPYGRIFPWQQNWIIELGLTHVFWTLDVRDYRNKPYSYYSNKVTKYIQAGDILLLHDGQKYTRHLLSLLDYIIDELGVKPEVLGQ